MDKVWTTALIGAIAIFGWFMFNLLGLDIQNYNGYENTSGWIVTQNGVVVLEVGHTPQLPTCQHEDGNPDGHACIWMDPDTGNKYYLDGSDYRN